MPKSDAELNAEHDAKFVAMAKAVQANREDTAKYFREVMQDVPAQPTAGQVLTKRCAACGQDVYVSESDLEIIGCREELIAPPFSSGGVLRTHDFAVRESR